MVSAIASRNDVVLAAIAKEARTHLGDAAYHAAQSAASIMAMNNIYYRFLHLASNKEYGQMPARLRMQVIANPGVEKVDFELWCLTVSAINGCGMCIDAHEKVLQQAGASTALIHDAVRIASVVHAAARALEADRQLADVPAA